MIDQVAKDEEEDGDSDNGADAGHGQHETTDEFAPA